MNRPERNCDRCGARYPERKGNADVTFFLCDRCKQQYEDIVDFYDKAKHRLIKQEAEALWNFLQARTGE